MLITISIATGGFILGYALSHFSWKAAYNNLYKVSIKTIEDQQRDNNKATYTRVRAKLDDIDRIMKEQLALWGQVDGPNRGAAHSKWKRDIANQINNLETEKMSVFKDILSDGVDLMVSVMDSNGMKQNKKMSEIVSESDATESKANPSSTKTTLKSVVKPKNKNEPNKKLRLVKESKLSLIKDNSHDK